MTEKKSKPSRPNIVVKNEYFEIANPGNPIFQQVIKENIFRDPISHYWLSRALQRASQLAKEYLEARATVARNNAHHYDKDGEQRDKDGNLVRSWKKGDPITFPDGSVAIQNAEQFRKDLTSLQAEEIDFGIPQVPFNELLDLPPNEEMVILPLMEEITEKRLQEISDEEKLQKLYKDQQKWLDEKREREVEIKENKK